jgi:hypothetical protein
VEQPNDARNPDSDQALGTLSIFTSQFTQNRMSLTVVTEQDEAEAINKSNIVKGDLTRGAKPEGSYVEPGDEEGLPANDGTSATR